MTAERQPKLNPDAIHSEPSLPQPFVEGETESILSQSSESFVQVENGIDLDTSQSQESELAEVEGWVTLVEAMEYLEIGNRQMRRLIKSGLVRKVTAVSWDDLVEYKQTRTIGRPKKKTRPKSGHIFDRSTDTGYN